jgi:UDP-3-O-acyl-N-acetylglucosamine deacetylase
VGLFTGGPGVLRISPANPGAGISLRRAGGPTVPAHISSLAAQPEGVPARNTALAAQAGSGPFLTVEHILSALAGLSITDALLELEGPEVPIGDSSADPFVSAILAAGIAEQDGAAPPLRLTREITVERGQSRITARPHAGGCLYRYELDYGPDCPIRPQSAEWDSAAPDAAEVYARDIAPARTFCLEAEARIMQATGLFAHLSPRDMLVFGEDGPIDNTLRFENEPARHKLLDLIGDLALTGRPLAAEVTALRSGHALNHELARAILAATP